MTNRHLRGQKCHRELKLRDGWDGIAFVDTDRLTEGYVVRVVAYSDNEIVKAMQTAKDMHDARYILHNKVIDLADEMLAINNVHNGDPV